MSTTFDRLTRRQFLVHSTALVVAPCIGTARAENSDDSINRYLNFLHEDGSGQSGISVTVHPPGGGHIKSANVVITPFASKSILLTRERGQQVYFRYLSPGSYKVCVEADGFERSCAKAIIRDGFITMLPIYLGKEGWPVFQMGGCAFPFEAVFDKVGIVFVAPFWRIRALTPYLTELKKLDLTPFNYDADNKDLFTAGDGSIVLLRDDNANEIFSRNPPSVQTTSMNERLMKLRDLFPKDKFGEIRIGIPIQTTKGNVKLLDNQFLVEFNSSLKQEQIDRLTKEKGASATKLFDLEDVWLLKFKDEANYLANLQTVEELLETGDLLVGEPNLIMEIRDHGCDASDPWFTCQEYIGKQKINSVWNLAGGKGCGIPEIVVTSIDRGVNRSTQFGKKHPDLNRDKVTCVNLANAGLDIDCNSVPFNPHGMGIFGIIGAEHNAVGISGIAPGTTHVAISRISGADVRSYAAMLKWAGGLAGARPLDINGNDISNAPSIPAASVINCSHGIEYIPLPSVIGNAIKKLTIHGRNGAGTIIIYSAGDGGSGGAEGADVQGIVAAAMSPYTVIVGNTASANCSCVREVRDPTSNFGWRLDLCAFGGMKGAFDGIDFSLRGPSLYSNNDPDQEFPPVSCGLLSTNGVTGFGRTSAAAAMVSGVASLVLSANPNLKWDKVCEKLKAGADKIDSTCPQDGTCIPQCNQYMSCGGSSGHWKKLTASGWISVLEPTTQLPAGLNYKSDWYGYGQLNAYVAVTLVNPQ